MAEKEGARNALHCGAIGLVRSEFLEPTGGGVPDQDFYGRALRGICEAAHPLPVGAMLETPVAALAIPEILALADFVTTGRNDLMQCLCGADRDIAQLSGYVAPYAPALFRFLRGVAIGA